MEGNLLATYTKSEIRAAAQSRRSFRTAEAKLFDEFVAQESFSSTKRFDVFLSHSTRDAEIILGVKAMLEGMGKSVYVDWINDRQLDRSHVTPSTAITLRSRMRQSQSLLYVHSDNSTESRWMPWELGYSDALHGAVAILPITDYREEEFRGQEYLGIYPYVVRNTLTDILEVRRSRYDTLNWTSWVQNPRTFVKTG